VNYLHTHPRRLVAALLLVGGMGLVLALTHSARSANTHSSSSTGTVSYYHQDKLLGSTVVASGSGLDVVWKDTTCSNGYGSPPTVFTWSGTSTGVTSAPFIGPCGHAPGTAKVKGPDDWFCTFNLLASPPWNCDPTYRTLSASGGATVGAKVANPKGGTIGNLYLYKRTALYAYLVTPGKPNKKISVPAGTDTIQFAPTP